MDRFIIATSVSTTSSIIKNVIPHSPSVDVPVGERAPRCVRGGLLRQGADMHKESADEQGKIPHL